MSVKKSSNKKRKSIIKRAPENAMCPFCREKKLPDYKDYENLKRFVTDRAKIIPASRSGVCAKHQRRLGTNVKRARHLGLLPFIGSL